MKTTILSFLVLVALSAAEAQSTWTVCNSTTTQKLLCIFMPGENKVLAGGENGTLLMSTDFGSTFSTISVNPVEDIKDLHFFNAQSGLMLNGDNLMKSADGGLTWSFVSEIPGKPKAMHFLNPDSGFVACDLGEAFSTFNGGLSWNSLVTGVTERLDAVRFKNINDGFFGGRNSTSLRTFNQGQGFSGNVIPANGDIKDIRFVNSNNGYTCGDNGEILFTGDGGNNWSAQAVPTTDPGLNALHFTDALNGWCSGETGTIFHTSDGGITWLPDNSNTLYELNKIHLFDNTHGFAAGDNGTIVRLGDALTAINEANTGLSGLSIYPQPVRSATTISFTLTGSSDVTISLYTLVGTEVKTLQKGMMESGKHALRMDCSDLPDGIYFCSVRLDGDTQKSGRLIVSR